jgi:endonuclease/exonuclease/phosphatase family metal-dependent hydrolase
VSRTTVTVVAYNVHGGSARGPLAQVVTALKPDVLVVNESPKLPLVWRWQCDRLAREWGLGRVAGGRNAGQNLLCASDRVEVLDSAASRLPQPLLKPIRGIVSAQCAIGGRPFGVVGVHLSLLPDRRAAEARAAVAVAAGFGGPVVVCGDLNERPGRPAWQQFAAAGFADVGAASGPTFSSADPRKRIDAILIRAGRVISYGVPSLPPSLYSQASDHLPVCAVLELPA